MIGVFEKASSPLSINRGSPPRSDPLVRRSGLLPLADTTSLAFNAYLGRLGGVALPQTLFGSGSCVRGCGPPWTTWFRRRSQIRSTSPSFGPGQSPPLERPAGYLHLPTMLVAHRARSLFGSSAASGEARNSASPPRGEFVLSFVAVVIDR